MMLEKLQSRFQYVLLAVLVVMIAGVFATQFGGQQAQGYTGGGATYAVSVDGEDVSEGDFRALYQIAGFGDAPVEAQKTQNLRRLAANGVVERRLLANEARKLGLTVTAREAMENVISKGRVYYTVSVDAPSRFQLGYRPVSFDDENGVFQREYAENFIGRQLQRSIGEFSEWQAEELMAERMREVLRSGVQIGGSELWEQFVRERDRARIRYVRYAASHFRERVQPTAADLDAFVASHAQEIDQAYQQNRFRYTGLELQVRARHILVKVENGADEATKAAARARAVALLGRARRGEDFAVLARENSEDEGSARRGGDLGWNPRGRMVPAFDAAMFALTAGQISDVVESPYGFHVIKSEGRREGDVPVAEAKREIAEDRYRDAKASELAKQAANEALAAIRGGKTMDALAAELTPPAAEGAPAPRRDPSAPSVEETGEFGPSDAPLQGAADSNVVAQSAFRATTERPLPDAPVALGQDYVIYELVSRTEPTRAAFTADEQARLRSGLLARKRQDVVAAYARELRTREERAGRVQIHEATLRYPGDPTEEEAAAAAAAAGAESSAMEAASMSSMASGMND